MSVLRPRNRLVNFRLSEDEFELLRDSCGLFGARSVSDFARTSVLERLTQRGDSSAFGGPGVGAESVGELGNKVAELESRVGQILNLLQATTAGRGPEPEPDSSVERAGAYEMESGH